MQLLPNVTYVGIDTETHLIGPRNLAPKLVCVSTAYWDGERYVSELLGSGDREELLTALRSILSDPSIHLVAHNAKFDFAVLMREFPELGSLIWSAYESERIHCTQCREKVLNLSDHGRLKNKQMPDGSFTRIRYSLNALGKDYLGRDRSDEKEGEDIWRTNFAQLDGKRASEYPADAAEYAKEDAVECLQVFYAQQQRQLNEQGPCSLNTSEFQAAVDFALHLISCYGMKIDPEWKERVEKELKDAYAPENYPLMIGAGVLRAPEPPRPYKRKAPPKATIDLDGLSTTEKRELITNCWTELGQPEKVETSAKGTVTSSVASFQRLLGVVLAAKEEGKELGMNCQHLLTRAEVEPKEEAPKMTKGKPESINKKKLEALVASLRTAAGLPIIYSNPKEPDESKRNVSCTAEVISEIVHLSPVLEEYKSRQEISKLVTTELPRMGYPDGTTADVVHPVFDVLKRSTRTSSFAGGTRRSKGADGKERDTFIFPSFNGQNVDPRVRPCFVARDGWLLLSIDYSSIELVSAAHRQLELFGHSKLADLILQGVDLHAWMAGQLAYNLNDDFRKAYQEHHADYDEMLAYEVFYACKSSDLSGMMEFYDHWRKFAKPVDLGFPGGLGAYTFVSFAKGYGVSVSEEMAKMLRNIWLTALPEYKLGFDWINNNCKDSRYPILGYDSQGKPKQGYAYSTPLGAYRSACAYTDACNGNFLQSPTAEGAKIAVFDCVRACYDETKKSSAAYGCRPVDFIHDELLFEIPEDGYEQERAEELGKLMVDAMKLIFPRLPVKVEPALSRRWYKQAKMVLDNNGRLKVWEPKEEK